MSYLRKGELLPVKGYNFSVPSTYLPEGHGFPQNMHFFRGEMRKRDGRTKLGNPVIGNHKVMHLGVFRLSDLSVRLMAHTRYNLMRYNTSTKKFDDFTGIDLTGDETKFFDHTVVTENDLYIFTNGVDEIRKFDDSADSSALSAGVIARFVEYMSPYLFVADVTEGGLNIPTKGKWSDSGDPTAFASGNAGSKLFTDDPTAIRAAKKLKEFLFIYKEGMTYRGRIVSTSDIFSFNIFDTDQGLYSPRALADGSGQHFFMGLNDFYVNNAARIQSIGRDVREYIFNRLNREKNETCHAVHVAEYKEVWFFITPTGEDWPTEVWKYNYDVGFWYYDTCNSIITASNYKIVETVAWDDLIGTWDEQPQIWDEQAGQADAPIQVFGDKDGIVSYRDPLARDDFGVAFTSRMESRDYTGLPNLTRVGDGQTIIGIEEDIEWMQLDLWAKGGCAKIYYSLDYGDSWVFVEEREFTDAIKKHSFFIHVISPQIRFKAENDQSGETFYIRAWIPYYLDAGQIEEPS